MSDYFGYTLALLYLFDNLDLMLDYIGHILDFWWFSSLNATHANYVNTDINKCPGSILSNK